MRAWGRVLSIHLIDQIIRQRERHLIVDWFDWVASTTHLPGEDQQSDGGTRWVRELTQPATMRTAPIRIVLGSDGITIATAFRQGPWKSRRHPS